MSVSRNQISECMYRASRGRGLGTNQGSSLAQDPARGSGQELFSKPSESSRVGSGGVRNLTGSWIGSNQEGFKYDGSGRVTLNRCDPREVIRPVRSPGDNQLDPYRGVRARGRSAGEPASADSPRNRPPCNRRDQAKWLGTSRLVYERGQSFSVNRNLRMGTVVGRRGLRGAPDAGILREEFIQCRTSPARDITRADPRAQVQGRGGGSTDRYGSPAPEQASTLRLSGTCAL